MLVWTRSLTKLNNKERTMNSWRKAVSALATFIACLGFSSAAHAQLTYQDVTFTTSWSGNVLTVEIDAANPSGDWATATTIGALQVKDIGTWDSVSMTGPGAASSWTIAPNELSANGCDGGSSGNMRACAYGTHVTLTDDMIFTFTFTGGVQDFSSPQLKVLFYEGDGTTKVGSLLSMNVPAVPEPGTYAMLLGGLGIVAFARRRASKSA